MARRFKRDTRGRFSRVAGAKGSAPKRRPGGKIRGRNSSSPVRSSGPKRRINPQTAAIKKGRRQARNVAIAGAIAVGAASYYTEVQMGTSPSSAQRRVHATQMAQRITSANARGLGQMKVATRRRGVYNITTL